MDPIDVSPIRDGVAGDLTAAKVNLIVSALNETRQELTTLQRNYAALNKAQVVSVATKLSTTAYTATSVVGGWLPTTNVDGLFNPVTGIFSPKLTDAIANYEVKAKLLISSTTALTTRPRIKAWIDLDGVEMDLAEEEVSASGGAFRQTLDLLGGTFAINPGAKLSLKVEFQGATDIRVLNGRSSRISIERKV